MTERNVWKRIFTLVVKEHLGERRQADQVLQHRARVGIMRAVVVGLRPEHGLPRVLTLQLLVLVLQELLGE